MKVAGIYLAAGRSSRMGAPKLSLELAPGSRLGGAALSELALCGLEPLAVVVRADDPLDWLPTPAASAKGWRTVVCREAAQGMSFSLRCGLSAVRPERPDAVVVALADQPFVAASDVERIVAAYRQHPDVHYVASGYKGAAMPPALFSRKLFPALEALKGDRGARSIFVSPQYRGMVLETGAAELPMDADTAEDFQKIKRLWDFKMT